MKYQLIIIKHENNDNYEAEMAKWKEDNQFGYFRDRNGISPDSPQLQKSTRSLEVLLTEEEFKKVKSEVIKVFE